MDNSSVKIDNSWKKLLEQEFTSPYFQNLKTFLVKEKKQFVIYPKGKDIFSAFNLTPVEKVKVVIIGQDPYHGPNQANGLCFSVSDGIAFPPSLKNIFKELCNDMSCKMPKSGNLEHWAKQGILMLNATLTVRAHQAGSHQRQGWEEFTDSIIKKISAEKDNLIFLLWGKFAQSKEKYIDLNKHYILKASHPSPFSAHSGFFGCKHFTKTNEILNTLKLDEIKWVK